MPQRKRRVPGNAAKDAVDKYLEQIRLVTALASALFISPSLVQVGIRLTTNAVISTTDKWLLITSNILFLVAILLTYFVYSSVVGNVQAGIYAINRPATKWFSIAQFAALMFGCIALVIFFVRIV